MALWKPKLKAGPSPDKAMASFRLDPVLQERLKALAKFWTELDKRTAGEDAAVTTTTDVVARLLESGLEGCWAEIGLEPKTKKEWDLALDKAEVARRRASEDSK